MYVYCFNSLFATFIFDIFLCFRLFAILFYHPYDKYAFLARLRWMCIKIQFFCYFCLALPLFTQNGYYFIRSEFFWMDFVRITYVYIHIYPQNEQRERKHTKNPAIVYSYFCRRDVSLPSFINTCKWNELCWAEGFYPRLFNVKMEDGKKCH